MGQETAGSCLLTARPLPTPQDVVNCVGGMGALLPLLERVATQPQEAEAGPAETYDLVGPELTSGRNTQGLLLPLGKSSGKCPWYLGCVEKIVGDGGLECLKCLWPLAGP